MTDSGWALGTARDLPVCVSWPEASMTGAPGAAATGATSAAARAAVGIAATAAGRALGSAAFKTEAEGAAESEKAGAEMEGVSTDRESAAAGMAAGPFTAPAAPMPEAEAEARAPATSENCAQALPPGERRTRQKAIARERAERMGFIVYFLECVIYPDYNGALGDYDGS